MRYREATVTDVAEMAKSRLTDPEAGEADWRMAAYFTGKHHPQRARSPRVGYVAMEGETVVGYIAGHLTRRYGCDGELQYLFVALPHRRTGVASNLLRLLGDWFVKQGARRVCVDVGNDQARPFYRRHGAVELNKHWMVWNDISGLS